jgi:hypothetical protein
METAEMFPQSSCRIQNEDINEELRIDMNTIIKITQYLEKMPEN